METLCAPTATHQYTRALRCSAVVPWRRAVVRGVPPAVPAASPAHQAALGVSATARSPKRDRGDTGVAAALGRDAARLAAPGGPAVRASPPRGGPGATRTGRDGHHGAATEPRLQAWRGPWAAPLPGPARGSVAQPRRVRTAVVVTADGPAQERRGIARGL